MEWTMKTPDEIYWDQLKFLKSQGPVKISDKRRLARQLEKNTKAYNDYKRQVEGMKALQGVKSKSVNEPFLPDLNSFVDPPVPPMDVVADTMAVFQAVRLAKEKEQDGVYYDGGCPMIDYEEEVIPSSPNNEDEKAIDGEAESNGADSESSFSSLSGLSLSQEQETMGTAEKLHELDIFGKFYNVCHMFGLNDRAIISISAFIHKLLSGEFGTVQARSFPTSRNTLKKRLTGPTQLGARFHWRCSAKSPGANAVCGKWQSCVYEKKLSSMRCCGKVARPMDTHFMTLELRLVLKRVLPNVFPCISEALLDYDGFRRIRDGFNLCKDDIILILNTDGVSISNSSRKDAWPVLASVAGTPEFLRFDGVNTFLVAIWSTIEDKTDLQEMLRQVADQIIETQRNPIKWIDYSGKEHLTRVFLGPVVTDAQARPKVSGLPHFNGKYGCITCKHYNPGHYFVDSNKEEDRTHEEYELAAAVRGFKKISPEAQQAATHNLELLKYDLKFRSPLCDVPGFDIVEGLPLDCMHAFGHGVFAEWLKMILNLGREKFEDFSRKPSRKRSRKVSASASSVNSALSGLDDITFENRPEWNIDNFSQELDDSASGLRSEKLVEIDRLFKNVRPPNVFSRRPRGLKHFKHFKASEWTIATTIILPPILRPRMPAGKFNAYKKLLHAFETLNKPCRTSSELRNAEMALAGFSKEMRLDDKEQVRYNIHQLSHASKFYRLWGPLHVTSAAPFENFNAVITRGIVKNQHAISHFLKNYANSLILTGGRRQRYTEKSSGSNTWQKKLDCSVTVFLRPSVLICQAGKESLLRHVEKEMKDACHEFTSCKFYKVMEAKFLDGCELKIYGSLNTGAGSHNSSFFYTATGNVVEVLCIALDVKADVPKLICKQYFCRKWESSIRMFLVPNGLPDIVLLCPSVLRKPVVVIEDHKAIYFAVLNTSVIAAHQ